MPINILNILSPINSLKEVKNSHIKPLAEIAITRAVDLLFYFPTNIIHEKFCNSITDLNINQHCIIKLKVLKHQRFNKNNKIICIDSQGNPLDIIMFASVNKFIYHYFPINQDIIISGKPQIFNNKISFTHPTKLKNGNITTDQRQIVYKRYKTITSATFQTYIQIALNLLINDNISEWLSDDFLKKYNLPSFKEALLRIHDPYLLDILDPNNIYIKRLAIDEILAYQLALQQGRTQRLVQRDPFIISKDLVCKFIKNLPFQLTNDQNNAIDDIYKEFTKKQQNMLLLQGDVGSGKTAVCFISSLFAKESNLQTVFMAPTDILATQHYNKFAEYAGNLELKICLLKGKMPQKTKKQIIEDIKNNHYDIIIGTHALFQDKIAFANLGLVIIDEQHRFGVNQRLKLAQKGTNPNIILTTATPIPRTLALALHGDIKILEIKNKPKQRKEIISKTISNKKWDEIILYLKQLLAKNEKIFWICPLIEETEKLDFSAAETRYHNFKELFPSHHINLIHGKIAPKEKQEILENFNNNKLGAILISTTVIEVGIDIPSCNIMIIENADRFGLAQLHQLRGRIGRSDKQGICIFLYDAKISTIARKRLKIIKETNDGFVIADKDLQLRGFGDLLGTQQSGGNYFQVANLDIHSNYILPSIKLAKYMIHKINDNDTNTLLQKDNLLNLFQRATSSEYINVG